MRSAAAINHGRWNGGGDHAFTGAAGVLRTDVPVHEKLHRIDIPLLAEVFADRHQCATAVVAGAAFSLVMVNDVRQMLGQRLPTGARAQCTGFG